MNLQHEIFDRGEADNWYIRNKEDAILINLNDTCQNYLRTLPLAGKRILEVGCSYGYRLNNLVQLGAECWGTEPSSLAVKEGSAMYPLVHLSEGVSHDLGQFPESFFDLVLVSFVLHWVDRTKLLQTVSEVDRVLKDGGVLVIHDFYPDVPHKRPYHHLKDAGVFTFKQPYWDIFKSSNLYTEIERIPSNHGSLEMGMRNEHRIKDASITGSDTAGMMVAFRKELMANYPTRIV